MISIIIIRFIIISIIILIIIIILISINVTIVINRETEALARKLDADDRRPAQEELQRGAAAAHPQLQRQLAAASRTNTNNDKW